MTDTPHSLLEIAQASETERPKYFDDTVIDDLLTILLELAEDNCVLRDRLKTAATLDPSITDKINSYVVSQEETQQRLADHSDTINALLKQVSDTLQN